MKFAIITLLLIILTPLIYFYIIYYAATFKLLNFALFRFYINIQIMNNECFDVLNYIRTRSPNEKQILYEYFFESKFY